MRIKKMGVIDSDLDSLTGLERSLSPVFFMGTSMGVRKSRDASEFVRLKEQFQALGAQPDPSAGQFLFSHQCEGYACSQRYLRGILMPLQTCKDDSVRFALRRVSNQFGGWSGDFPIEALKVDGEEAVEAYIPFLGLNEAYRWLQSKGFEYIVELGESFSPATVQLPSLEQKQRLSVDAIRALGKELDAADQTVLSRLTRRTNPLPWNNVDDFSRWLSLDGSLPVKVADLCVAFLYENSD